MAATDSSSRAEGERPPLRYRPLLELGEGGTAKVHLAVGVGPAGFNKLVVLKVLKRQLASDEELRRMFLAEARLSARLSHPNIVEVHEVLEREGIPAIVMQYLEGRPYSELIRRGAAAVPVEVHLRVIADALAGLHYAHELRDYDGTPLKVVHRDMSPQNVFVTYDGLVKLLDFGIAKVGGGAGYTETGVIKGKLRYMPPEQVAGEQVDRRADLFAVGVMLWEAATGERMWGELPEATIMNRVLAGEIPHPRAVNADCDEHLERIILRALADDRNDRYATADELREDLEQFLDTRGDPIGRKDVGELVSDLFEEDRERIQHLVETKLAGAARISSLDLEVPGLDAILFGDAADQGHSVFSAEASEDRTSPWWRAFGLASVVVALAVALVFTVAPPVSRAGAPHATGSAAPPPAASAADAESALGLVRLRLTVFPDAARATLDGEPLDGNPHVSERPPSDTPRELVVVADGFAPRRERLVLASDLDLVLRLEPTAPPAAPAQSGGPSASSSRPVGGPSAAVPRVGSPPPPLGSAAPATSASVPAETAPKLSCDPPYYFDERGLKRYRAECL